MRHNKYYYCTIIQQNCGQGWEDVSEYETNSAYCPKEYIDPPKIDGVKKARISLLRADLKEYRMTGYPIRTINRREISE